MSDVDKNRNNSLRKYFVDSVFWALLFICGLYVLGFFYYQYKTPDRVLLKHETVTYLIAENCELLVEYPREIPLEFPDTPGRPINIWFYLSNTSIITTGHTVNCSPAITTTTPVTYSIAFGPVGEGIEFTNQNGELIPATLSSVPAYNRSIAQPQTLYIRRTSSVELPISIMLQAQVFYTDGQERLVPLGSDLLSMPPHISPELPTDSRCRHFWKALFQVSGPIQWLITVVVSLLALLKFYYEWQDRRDLRVAKEKEERKQEEIRRQAELDGIKRQIDEIPVPEGRFQRYVNLQEKYQDSDRMQVLHENFRIDWFPYLQKDLVKCISNDEGAVKRLGAFKWEWESCIGNTRYEQLLDYCDLMENPPTSLTKKTWDALLIGFQILGLVATDCTVAWIDKLSIADAKPITEQLKGTPCETISSIAKGSDFEAEKIIWDSFESSSRAAALYLVRRSKIAHNYEFHLPSSRKPHLWPQQEGLIGNIRSVLLGAEKAEYDYNLLTRFYRTHAWDELQSTQPDLFIAPAGSGRTALIWKARDEPPTGSFLVYAHAAECKPEVELLRDIQHAIAQAWYETVAKDPNSLLGLEESERCGVATLLLQDAGDQERLLNFLEFFGLQRYDPARSLLEDTLHGAVSKQNQFLLRDLPHLHPYGCNYTLLLVDVNTDDIEQSSQITKYLLDLWLPVLGPRAIIPKVFVYAKPSRCSINPITLTWSRDDLSAMLEKRKEDLSDVLETCVKDLARSEEALLLAAQGSPQRLIALGNALLREKEHFPLDKETFDGILGRCI